MRLVVPVLTRLVSALAALAILSAGVIVLVELVANWTGNGFVILPEDWPDQLRSTSCDDTVVRNVLIASVVSIDRTVSLADVIEDVTDQAEYLDAHRGAINEVLL